MRQLRRAKYPMRSGIISPDSSTYPRLAPTKVGHDETKAPPTPVLVPSDYQAAGPYPSTFGSTSRRRADSPAATVDMGLVNLRTPGQVDKILESPRKHRGISSGTYAQVSGRIEDRKRTSVRGRTSPSGHWLVLDRPITIDGQSVTELFAGHARVNNRDRVVLNARLDLMSSRTRGAGRKGYVKLTGITNPGLGEPVFDGSTYKSCISGKALITLSWKSPHTYDRTTTLLVLDPSQNKAFLAAYDRDAPLGLNPFYGVNGSLDMRPPTDAETGAIKWYADGTAFDRTSLKALGPIARDATKKGANTSWFRNTETDTLYCFAHDGIDGAPKTMEFIVVH